MPVLALVLLDKVGKNMPLQMVHLDQRPVKGDRKPLGERSAHQE